MHSAPDFVQPTSIATIDGPAAAGERAGSVPWSTSDEWGPATRLRYIGAPQAALSRRVRPRRRRAAILDLEGVLVDTREASTLAWLVALHDGGHDVSIDLLRQLSGVASGELLRIVAGLTADSPEGQEIMRLQEQTFRTWYLPRILPFAGARRLLQRMKTDGLRLIALSGGRAELAPELVRASGVADLLDDIVAADGEPRDAAVADIVTSVIARSECARENIVMLGDSPYDVATGERNGIDVVALRCGGWSDATLQGAMAVYEDHLHLLSQYPASPLGSTSHMAVPQLRLARAQ